MRRLLAGTIVCGLVALMMAVTPALAATSIRGLSHTHPDGENFSYFCGKIKGRPGTRYVAKASGPAVVDGTIRFKMGNKGIRKVVFEIESAGQYTLKVRKASGERILAEDSYNVPPPPPGGAAEGPFPCVN